MNIEIILEYIADIEMFNDSPISFNSKLEKALSNWADNNNEIHNWVNEDLEEDLLLGSRINLKTDIKNKRVISFITYQLKKELTNAELEKIIEASTGQLSDGYGEEPISIILKEGIFTKRQINIGLLGISQTYPIKIEKKINDQTSILYQKIECSKDILEAVENGDFTTVKEYVENDGNVNCKCVNEDSLLILAISKKQEKIAFYLIENGADIFNKNNLLVHTCISGLLKLAEYFINNGADVNSIGHNQRTPLMWASRHLALVKLLAAKGADVNAQDISGRTVLGLTINPDVVTFLLSVGADPKLTCFMGKTALDYNIESLSYSKDRPDMEEKYKAVIEILENATK